MFWSAVQWIVNKQRVVGAACLVGMTLLTCADVVGRVFRHPIFGTVEIVGFMATLAVAMALPYTHQVEGHIGVEILVRKLPQKVCRVIDLCTSMLSLGLFALVTWRMATYAYTIQGSGEVSMNLEFPEYLIIYLVAFCFIVLTLIILQDTIRYVRKLKRQ
jgi:TRAP-type C4-dicarboxylate transport system permease small subunit